MAQFERDADGKWKQLPVKLELIWEWQKGKFQWKFKKYTLWQDTTVTPETWQISDGGGWYQGVYFTAEEALAGATNKDNW